MRRILALLVLLAIPAVAQFGGPMGGMRPGSMQGGGLLPGRGGDPLWIAAGPTKPTLDFDFAKRKDLTDAVSGKTSLVTFSRSAAQSPGTYVGSDGLIHDAAVNSALYSEQFDNGYWTKGSLSVSANQTSAPDGKQTADKFTPNSTSTVHFVTRYSTFGSGTFTFSVYAKYAGYPRIGLRVYDGSTYKIRTTFDIENGIVVLSEAGTPAIESVGNGWYRLSVTGTSLSGNMGYISGWVIESLPGDKTTQQSFAGDEVSGAYLWGAQIEETDAALMGPSPYIHTTSQALAAPRFDHDPVTGESLGLLVEEARTNLTLYSEQLDNAHWVKRGTASVTANAATAPDGTQTADLITGLNGLGQDIYNSDFPSPIYTAGAPIAVSVWIKRVSTSGILRISNPISPLDGRWAVDLSALGDGWNRITDQHPAVTVLAAFTGSQSGIHIFADSGGPLSVYAWGLQTEDNKTFPTSYIPTAGSAQTRYADVAAVQDEDFSTTNLISYSESFDVGWSSAGIDSVTSNSIISPDGQLTADRVIESAASTQHYIYTPNSLPVQITSGVKYTFSVFVKKGTGSSAPDIIQMNARTLGFSYLPYANFNISTGSVTLQSGGNAGIQSYGNGWFKITLTATADTTVSVNTGITIGFCNNNPNAVKNPTYAGSTNSDVYLWGASLTATEYPVAYTTTRNLLTDSQDFERSGWTTYSATFDENASLAPDGTQTSHHMIIDSGTTGSTNNLHAGLAPGDVVTASLWINTSSTLSEILVYVGNGGAFAADRSGAIFNTATGTLVSSFVTGAATAPTVNISSIDGAGWYRVELTTTLTTSNPVFVIRRVSGTVADGVKYFRIWGAQLEPGTATDYVRTVDVVGKSYNWYEPTEGTVFAEADVNGIGANAATIAYVSNYPTNSPDNRLEIRYGSPSQSVIYSNAPTPSFTMVFARPAIGSTFSAATAYRKDDFAGIFSGQSIQTDNSGDAAYPVTAIHIGQNSASTSPLNGHIHRLTYWPRRQSDSTLQVITQ